MATYASPIAAARAPTPILRDCPPRVPTFSNICAPSAVSGSSRQMASTTARFTECLLGSPRDGWDAPASSDNDEPADLLAQFAVDRIDVDTAHDLLTVSRDQIPRDRTLAAGHGILAVLEI